MVLERVFYCYGIVLTSSSSLHSHQHTTTKNSIHYILKYTSPPFAINTTGASKFPQYWWKTTINFFQCWATQAPRFLISSLSPPTPIPSCYFFLRDRSCFQGLASLIHTTFYIKSWRYYLCCSNLLQYLTKLDPTTSHKISNVAIIASVLC